MLLLLSLAATLIVSLLVILLSIHNQTHDLRVVNSSRVGLHFNARNVWVDAALEQTAAADYHSVVWTLSIFLKQEQVLVHESLVVREGKFVVT